MAGEAAKIKSAASNAPLGALGGAILGYLTAKMLGYEKNLSVVSFTMVGFFLGAAIGAKVHDKLNS